MRVVMLTSWFPSERDPVSGVFVQDQALALSARCELAVVAPQVGWWGRAVPRRVDADLEGALGLRVIRPWGRSAVPRSPTSALEAWKRAARRGIAEFTAAIGPPDLIHAQVCVPAGWAGVQLGAELSIPSVLTEHLSPFDPPATLPGQIAKVREAVSRSSAVLAVSPFLADEILRFEPAADVRVVGNLVRTDLFTPGGAAREERPLFLAVGGLGEQKGFGTLLRATRNLVESGVTGFEVVIVGEGPLKGQLADDAKGLPVTFQGWKSREELRDLMRESAALVAPSEHESFGLVIAEAMSCGRPVIATRCGGPGFVVGPDDGILVPVGSVDGLAAAMRSFIDGTAHVDGVAVRDRVSRRFGEEAFVEAVMGVYEQVTGSA